MRLIFFSSFNISTTSERVSIICIDPIGTPSTLQIASLIKLTIILFDCCASLPPLRITALPDFRHNEEICGIASGRDSKIAPITPIGQVIRRRVRPSSNSIPISSLPRPTTLLIPLTIPMTLFSSKRSREKSGAEIFSLSATSRSLTLASSIEAHAASRAEAISSKALFLISTDKWASFKDAALAVKAISCIILVVITI